MAQSRIPYNGFKIEIRKTMNCFGDNNLGYQDVGLVTARMKDGIGAKRYQRVLQLSNEVDPKIYNEVEN